MNIFKIRSNSPQRYNTKANYYFKIFLIIGIILFFCYLLFQLSSIFLTNSSLGIQKTIYDFSISHYPKSILSLSVIIIAISVIFYFFHIQFSKLAEIADEIENNEFYEDTE